MDPFPAIYQSDRFDNLQRTLHPTVPAIKTQVTFDERDRERKKALTKLNISLCYYKLTSMPSMSFMKLSILPSK